MNKEWIKDQQEKQRNKKIIEKSMGKELSIYNVLNLCIGGNKSKPREPKKPNKLVQEAIRNNAL
jgi:hypothetical protein